MNDCFKYNYDFILHDVKISFFQSGSRDLNFLCIPKTHTKKIDIEISKELNYDLYEVFNKLYNNIISKKNTKNINTKLFLDRIYDGSKISWQSDDYADEVEMQNGMVKPAYNYLNIYRKNDIIKLECINNSTKSLNNFNIAFNTDRSKNGIFVWNFMDLLNDLEEVTEEYKQITFDEYLYQKQLVKKNK